MNNQTIRARIASLFRPGHDALVRYMAAAGMILSANPGPAVTNSYSPQQAVGNISKQWSFPLTLTPASAPAAGISAQTFSSTGLGLQVGDIIVVAYQGAMIAGIAVADAYVSAADAITVRFANPTAGAVVPSAGTYQVTGWRPIPTSQQSLATPAISW